MLSTTTLLLIMGGATIVGIVSGIAIVYFEKRRTSEFILPNCSFENYIPLKMLNSDISVDIAAEEFKLIDWNIK